MPPLNGTAIPQGLYTAIPQRLYTAIPQRLYRAVPQLSYKAVPQLAVYDALVGFCGLMRACEELCGSINLFAKAYAVA